MRLPLWLNLFFSSRFLLDHNPGPPFAHWKKLSFDRFHCDLSIQFVSLVDILLTYIVVSTQLRCS